MLCWNEFEILIIMIWDNGYQILMLCLVWYWVFYALEKEDIGHDLVLQWKNPEVKNVTYVDSFQK